MIRQDVRRQRTGSHPSFFRRVHAGMKLTHIDDKGKARMVDVGSKSVTHRTAVATGFVKMKPKVVSAIRGHKTPKGDPLESARIAGILAAKRTSSLIPLCHPLPLDDIDVQCDVKRHGVALRSVVETRARTGVEMEALVAVSVAALTIYDMCKALDKSIEITDIALESKSGGKSGPYRRK